MPQRVLETEDPRVGQLRGIHDQLANLLRGQYGVPDEVISLLDTLGEMRTRIECGDASDALGFRQRMTDALSKLERMDAAATRVAASAIRRRLPQLWE